MRSNQSERDYNRAIAEYDAALRLFPNDFPSLYRHGLAKHRKSDAARVYQHYGHDRTEQKCHCCWH